MTQSFGNFAASQPSSSTTFASSSLLLGFSSSGCSHGRSPNVEWSSSPPCPIFPAHCLREGGRVRAGREGGRARAKGPCVTPRSAAATGRRTGQCRHQSPPARQGPTDTGSRRAADAGCTAGRLCTLGAGPRDTGPGRLQCSGAENPLPAVHCVPGCRVHAFGQPVSRPPGVWGLLASLGQALDADLGVAHEYARACVKDALAR